VTPAQERLTEALAIQKLYGNDGPLWIAGHISALAVVEAGAAKQAQPPDNFDLAPRAGSLGTGSRGSSMVFFRRMTQRASLTSGIMSRLKMSPLPEPLQRSVRADRIARRCRSLCLGTEFRSPAVAGARRDWNASEPLTRSADSTRMIDFENRIDELHRISGEHIDLAVIAQAPSVAAMHIDLALFRAEQARVIGQLCNVGDHSVPVPTETMCH
jgi:hypothetical protein